MATTPPDNHPIHYLWTWMNAAAKLKILNAGAAPTTPSPVEYSRGIFLPLEEALIKRLQLLQGTARYEKAQRQCELAIADFHEYRDRFVFPKPAPEGRRYSVRTLVQLQEDCFGHIASHARGGIKAVLASELAVVEPSAEKRLVWRFDQPDSAARMERSLRIFFGEEVVRPRVPTVSISNTIPPTPKSAGGLLPVIILSAVVLAGASAAVWWLTQEKSAN